MTNDATKIASAVTGSVYRAPLGTTAPTTQATSLNAGFLDLGYINEDGVTQSLPDSGESTTYHAWQGNAVVRIISKPSDEMPTIKFVALETNKTVLDAYYGASVTQTATEGSLIYNSTAARTHYSWVIDYIDGSELERIYVPDGFTSEVGERVYKNGELIGYEITVQCDYNSTLGGNFKLWTTRAKS